MSFADYFPKPPGPPSNRADFLKICTALKRNDADVSTVRMVGENCLTGFGPELGAALWHNRNAIVTELDLDLPAIVSREDWATANDFTPAETDSANLLLQWIQGSSSLRTVKLFSYEDHFKQDELSVKRILLRRIVQAMMRNPSIQAFETTFVCYPLPLLTEYLQSPNAVLHLKSLKMELLIKASAAEWDAASQAIRALTALHELSVVFWNRDAIEALLQRLDSSVLSSLRAFSVDLCSRSEEPIALSTVALLCRIWENNATQLERVDLCNLKVNVAGWTLLTSALQANPTIVQLSLRNCDLLAGATTLFTHDDGEQQQRA